MSEASNASQVRITVILNPSAGRGQAARRCAALKQLLGDAARVAGAEWELLETKAPCDATRLAAEAAPRSTLVVAAGGDGTLGEVVNGVMDGTLGANRPRLGLLPLGTGNDFARCLGIPRDWRKAVWTLFHGAPRMVDVGRATFENDGATHWFVNVAGCGFDGLAARRVNELRHRPGWRHVRGTAAYLCAVLQELATLRAASLRIGLDGEFHEQRAVLCAVANATSYGGGMRVAPDAQIDDGLFDVCLIGDAGRLEFLRAFPRVFQGTHVSHPKVGVRRAAEVSLASDPPLPVLIDGDVLGVTPVRFSIVPRALEVMAPVG